MIDIVFCYCLRVVDYAILLYFFNKLMDTEQNWKKAVGAILFMGALQYGKDCLMDFGSFSLLIDRLIAIAFLSFYQRPWKFLNFLYACFINGIFILAMTLIVSILFHTGTIIQASMIFTMRGLWYSVIIRLFILISFILVVHPFSSLLQHIQKEAEHSMMLILSMILILFSFLYGNFQSDEHGLLYTAISSLIVIAVFYLFYHTCILSKQQEDAKLIQQSMDITSNYVTSLKEEHDEIKEIRHDIKNQLHVMATLLQQGNDEEVQTLIQQLSDDLSRSRVSISGNVYIDAVLRLKMKEYPDIQFHLDITLAEGFHMEGQDIISLLCNIIDNACEELQRVHQQEFHLLIRANHVQFLLKEENPCGEKQSLTTVKDDKFHGYGLKIIHEIVDQYDGVIEITNEDHRFRMSILLPL